MTINDAKRDLLIMTQMLNRLVELDTCNARQVIKDLFMIYTNDSDLRTLGYCLSKLEKIKKHEGEAIVKFLVDRFSNEHDKECPCPNDGECFPPVNDDEICPFDELDGKP